MAPRFKLAAPAALTLGWLMMSPVFGDDPQIPAKCRTPAAADDEKCADLIESRFEVRSSTFGKRDKAANEALKQTILATKTLTGETIDKTLAEVGRHIPFFVNGWHFLYARSGTEYVVIEYDHEASPPSALSSLSLFDNDLETKPVGSLQNSRAEGYAVWKVTGKAVAPWGNYAEMLLLGPGAFAWSVNDARKGFYDSGYDKTFAEDFSFLAKIPAGKGTLADAIPIATATHLDLYWNVVDGYDVTGDGISCPSRTIGLFTIQAPDCGARAAAARDITGNLLPFKVLRAVRSHAYTGGMVGADVSVSVDGGGPGDWMATAAYVAEQSIIGDVTFATVSVFVPNPWGDSPPQLVKILAKAYYAPDPGMSPWKEKWSIFGARHAAALADVEYDKLSNDLIEDPDVQPDPDKRLAKASADAKRVVIRKYRLPKTWQPTENLGIDGQDHDREHIHINEANVDDSRSALQQCLTSDDGNQMLSGCMPERR